MKTPPGKAVSHTYLTALEAVMDNVDPATHPGLTAAQRAELSGFAKPAPRYHIDGMAVHTPNLHVEGPVAFHDQACAVYHDQSAVYNLGRGIFEPSWKAQYEGWRLVQIKTKLQRLILRWFFGRDVLDV